MAVGAALATAYVRIRPLTSGFGRDLDTQVHREVDGGRIGERVGQDIGQGVSKGVGRSVDGQRTGEKIGKDLGQGISRGMSPLITAAVGLGPALIPVLATATAAAGGLGVALISGGAALGVFGAVAKSSFKAIQDNLKLAKKGTEDLRSPIGRATNAYEGLTGAWDKFVAHNQPHVFRIFGAGFSILTQAIPKLQPLMDVAALAVARLEGQLGHFVSGGGLDRLVRFLTTNARPALESFRQTFTNLGSGFGALAPLFARFAGSVEVGLVGLSAKFAAWAKNGGPGGGFQRFIDYVVANGPTVASTLHELASAAVNIASGLAPLGPVSLSFVGAMARLIAVLPPGVITGLAAGFVSIQVALKGAALASDLFSLSIGRTPIGLAALALSGLITLFVHHAQAVAEDRRVTEDYRTTLDKTTGAITLDTRAMAAHNLQASGALDAALKLGLGLSTITDAAVGNQAAIGQVNTAVSTARANYDQFVGTGQAMDKSLGDQQTAAGILSKAIGTASGQVATARTRQQQLAAATQPTTVAIVSQAQAAQNAKRQLEQLSLSLLKVAGVNLNAAQTELQFRGSLDSLSQSVKNNGRSLSENTVKGRANRAAVLDSISAALQHANAVGEQTHSQTRAQQAFQNSIPAIKEQARRLGLNKQQVDALIRSIGGLKPKTVDVGVQVKGSEVVLSGGRSSFSTGAGKRQIFQTGQANGSILKSFASGSEHHVAQVARPGEWRVWAEPETGGEAYIPLAASKRPRSTTILSSVAKSFGFGLIPAASGTILNGPAGIGRALNDSVDRVANTVARAAVQALISAGQLTPAITSAPGAGGNVTRWAGVILSVLRALGQSAANLGAVERRIAFESGGNPNAINLTDSNARAGHPSQGLTQCVSLPTTILTRRGWLRHDEVRVGDETIGYNPSTGRSEWTSITKVVRFEDAEVWRIGNGSWHADVTPNHRWWSDTAVERSTETLTVCPECGWTGRPGIPVTPRSVSTHRGRLHGVREPAVAQHRGEFVLTDQLKSHHRVRLAAIADTDGIVGLSLEDVRIIAWLQGDGTLQPARDRAGYWDGTIWQSKPPMVVKLRSLLVGIKHTESVRQRAGNVLPAYAFRLRRAYVTDLIKRAELDRRGPESFVLALSPDQRAAWLDAMIDAEGHRQKGKPHWKEFVRIAQVNGPLQDAIRLAVFLEGYRPTFSANSAERNGYKPAGSVGMAGPHVAPSMFRAPRVLERQPVWCVKTDLETWTAQLDGQVFLTGNTIPGTFAAFAGPYRGRGITDPFANIYAGMNYALHRYGSIAAIDPLVRPRGYDNGGVFLPGMVGMNVNGGRERVLNSRETAAYEGGSGIDYKLLAAAVVAALDRSVLPVSIGREVHRNFAKGARA